VERLAHHLGPAALGHLCLAEEAHRVLDARREQDLGRVRPLLVEALQLGDIAPACTHTRQSARSPKLPGRESGATTTPLPLDEGTALLLACDRRSVPVLDVINFFIDGIAAELRNCVK